MSEKIISKTCRTCKQIKPLAEFYKMLGNCDGYDNQCKICHLKQCSKYAKTKKGILAHRKANHRYGKSEKGKSAKMKHRQSQESKTYQKRYQKNYARSEKGKDVQIRTAQKQRLLHPEKYKARQVVRFAIRSGKLPRPDSRLCHYCPKPAQQYHHHKGYAKEHWLDVVPVCVPCHNAP